MSRRLFIGLMAPAGVQEEIERYRQSWLWSTGARLTPRAKLHITIDFLGDAEEASEKSLRLALSSKVRMLPFRLLLRTPRVWPEGLAILEPQESDALLTLHGNIGLALECAGISRHPRPYVPHVTLARECQGLGPPSTFAEVVWAVDSFSLVWSRGRVASFAYEVLESWP